MITIKDFNQIDITRQAEAERTSILDDEPMEIINTTFPAERFCVEVFYDCLITK
jgi:hypothetical protein